MPQAGDSFTVQIGASQRDWGTFRSIQDLPWIGD